jgi:hypothetical protein
MRAVAGACGARAAVARRARLATVLAAALPLVLGTAAGCGRKTPPRPPEYVIPEPPAPVRVSAVPEGQKVSWSRPREYADGTRIDDLGAFDVFRDCGDGGFWTPIATLSVDDRERFRKGRTFSFVDAGVPPDAPCRYRVVAVTLDGYRSPPAEGAIGEEPPPEATPSPGALPGETPAPDVPPAAGEPGEPIEEPVPAPLATVTPFPPPPW